MPRKITSASAYHWATGYKRHGIAGHHLDFDQYPVPVKSYEFLNRLDIHQRRAPDRCSLEAVLYQEEKNRSPAQPDLLTLSGILFLAYGVIRRYLSGKIPFFKRPVPSAGGLYPCHLYVQIRGNPEIETGLYYCDMIHQRLGLIQKLDEEYRQKDSGGISFFITAQPDISSWKYRDRAFRYVLLDAGHLAEGLILSLRAFGFQGHLRCRAGDSDISQLLSLDEKVEIPICRVSIFNDYRLPVKTGGPARMMKTCDRRPAYPLLEEMADILRNSPMRRGAMDSGRTEGDGLKPFGWVEKGLDVSFEETVLQRASKRNFIPGRFDYEAAVQLIRTAAGLAIRSGKDEDDALSHLETACLCENVQSMENGLYDLAGFDSGLKPALKGNFHRFLARACLDQMWMAGAALQFLFVCDLNALEDQHGPQGYARVLLHAARIAHRVYLAAQALGLGCCAVGALYDDEAKDLFDLEKEKALFYVVSVGQTPA